MRLDTTERRIMDSRGSRHTLIIRKVQASDFANYSCVADNQIGKNRQKLELSGRPNPAMFVSDPRGKFRDMYNISWNVNSYTPIEEFKLSFRKVPMTSPQALPGHQQPPSPQQQLQHPPSNARRPTRRVSYFSLQYVVRLFMRFFEYSNNNTCCRFSYTIII
ncbi:hypothetical protein C0J52_27804 [Blattella germanica]|nr:hypothetical protein C0J52_27804 [Blattella germanica]